ncbi:MAG: response regulator [Deltaproteobacteria bacterium]|nr:response regulator [Deltaproteobacteria bacterium]
MDDEPTVLFAMSEYLTVRGFRVDTAAELEEALALIAHIDYSAVIADLRLTGTTNTEGLEVVAAVRERSPGTRIVLHSGYGSPELEREALSRNVDVVLHKPTPMARIVDCLTRLLGGAL